MVRVSVVIDGKEAWKLEIQGKPIRAPVLTVGGLAKSLFELLGFKVRPSLTLEAPAIALTTVNQRRSWFS